MSDSDRSGWLDVLRDRVVTDVLVPGWADRDGLFVEFRPQPEVVWLQLDEGVLRLRSVGQYDALEIREAERVDWSDIEFLDEAEDEVMVASWGEQFFGDGFEQLRCLEARAYETAAGNWPKCLALEFEGANTLFFDPTWVFGIRIGRLSDEEFWRRQHGPDAGTAVAVTSYR
ncbi:hypothetical protein DSC45_02840 [Streptomyces sp. YIM 130001]|uniref:hypothetical protein n=1 Tax=Streptomyces sp. YIM 130001 TaxID=2259644 RepID=UPI000E6464A9|nr:hypothetical protein [Streptomyces sp. YIM 130001]RII20758.1 hypothetical protein DSC45_02840 [Streptomyces sp. YIM 130001]